jgi:hypothetical protein
LLSDVSWQLVASVWHSLALYRSHTETALADNSRYVARFYFQLL